MLGILGLHFGDAPTDRKICWLERGEDGNEDMLCVQFERTKDEQKAVKNGLRQMKEFFLSLGCLPLRCLDPGEGSSIHYAGTFPMSTIDEELTCTKEGRLRGTKSVYLCDGSVFSSLPAKGLTFSLMANADRIGCRLAEEMREG